jgi:hypothetical protein
LVVGATGAWGQAVTGFSGGTQFNLYYGGSTGDVVGYRFTVSGALPLEVSDLGVWNQDTAAGGPGLTSDHEVGIWDSAQALLTSVTVTPAGTVVGDWTYASVTPVTLNPGETYTIGALYTGTDNDSYISSASSMTTAPEITFLNSVYPAAGSLGFVYPTSDSTSFGRFGPNFLYAVVPVELQSFTIE